jgi:hypothetical protein
MHFMKTLYVFLGGQCLYFSSKRTQTMQIKSITHNSIAMLFLKTFQPGGIRSQVFCSWGVCDVHCASPPGHFNESFTVALKKALKLEKGCPPRRLGHRNLRTRTSTLAQVVQIFLWKEHLVKNWLISSPRQGKFFKRTIFQRSTKPLFTSQNR